MIAQVLRRTYRFQVVNIAHRQQAAAQHGQGSFALALWHEHLFACILGHARQRFAPLASLSQDGDLVAGVMNLLGFNTVRGSSSRGGPEARDQLVAVVAQGYFTALTIDGPRGPRRRVKGGVVDVARRAQVAILPVITVAEHEWVLRSWDLFKIPKPFSRVILAYGPPITVAPDTQGLAFGAIKAALKLSLDQLEQQARLLLRRP